MSDLKKNNYRISLKFSEKDAEQAEVVKLLKQMGRRKSHFITKAVLYYLDKEPEAEIPNIKTSGKVSKDTMREMLKELLTEMNINPDAIPHIETAIQQQTQEPQPQPQQPSIRAPQVAPQPPEPVPMNNTIPSAKENKEDDDAIDDLLDGLDLF